MGGGGGGLLRTTVRDVALTQKSHITLAISSSHSILTPGQTSPNSDPLTPVARQGSQKNINFELTGMARLGKAGIGPLSPALGHDALPPGHLAGMALLDRHQYAGHPKGLWLSWIDISMLATQRGMALLDRHQHAGHPKGYGSPG